VIAGLARPLSATAWTGPDYARLFEQQRQLAAGREAALFGVFDGRLTPAEDDALRFLYAAMPLSDLADYDGAFFLDAVRASLEARRQTIWGAAIPEDVFRHYVLPLRVNNEALDDFRARYSRELLERVKDMPMDQAALEINHWCHERVTYQGSDARTSAAQATILTSWGRCGEETVLAVAALRAVCIPARQVYTPRWSHCDSNHAWVEAWVNGRWRFLGACEPEPALDMAWFREPARRAMLVHTRTYGPCPGPEPAVSWSSRHAELNLTSLYAPTKRFQVEVRGGDGQPAGGALVEFRLYNFAEFFPIVRCTTGVGGTASVDIGLGDALIWARRGESFGFRKVSVAAVDTVVVRLNRDPRTEQVLDFDMAPPLERPPLPPLVEDADRRGHERRLRYEDSLRTAYMATFPDSTTAISMAAALGIDGVRGSTVIRRSWGNWREITRFLEETPPSRREWALLLLESVAEKDLRDTPAAVLADHLEHGLQRRGPQAFDPSTLSPASADPEQSAAVEGFVRHVLCPRVDIEMLSPYRGYLLEHFPREIAAEAAGDPAALVRWIDANIKVDPDANYLRAPLSPRGVFELRVSDARSRDVFFVSLARSLGIAARFEPALRVPQYRAGDRWVDVSFATGGASPPEAPAPASLEEPGIVELSLEGVEEPRYWVHFTLARLRNGAYQTLEYDDATFATLPARLELPAGHYLVVTGNRLADGTVLSRMAFFNVESGQGKAVVAALRQDQQPLTPMGTLDLQAACPAGEGAGSWASLVEPKGALLLWATPGAEPTRHIMGDIRALKPSFETWGGNLAFLLSDPQAPGADFENLPAGSRVASDEARVAWRQIAVATGRSDEPRLPVLAVVDAQGRILYLSEGYRVGAGEQALKVIRRMGS